MKLTHDSWTGLCRKGKWNDIMILHPTIRERFIFWQTSDEPNDLFQQMQTRSAFNLFNGVLSVKEVNLKYCAGKGANDIYSQFDHHRHKCNECGNF